MSTVLVLRTCLADMRSPSPNAGGFTWPESGPVEAPDWDPEPRCGGGLHGALWGEGEGNLFCWEPDARWLVVEVGAADVVDLAGKVKFPRGVVVFCGDRLEATNYIQEYGAAGRAVIGGTATAGDRGTATAGYYGTATAGDRGTIAIRYRDGNRYRIRAADVGVDERCKPGVAYRLHPVTHVFEPVTQPDANVASGTTD